MAQLKPILDEDLDRVGVFLHREMNGAISPEQWAGAFRHPWMQDKPDNGMMLEQQGEIVGVLAAIYSERIFDGKQQRICNLTSWRVQEAHSAMSLALLKALVRRPDYTVLGTTPNEMVCRIYKLLGFELVPLERWVLRATPFAIGGQVLTGERARDALSGDAQRAWDDHGQFPWLHQLVLTDPSGAQPCHIIWRRSRWKRLPAATVLHLDHPESFMQNQGAWGRYLFWRYGIFSSHVEKRWLQRPQFVIGEEDYGWAAGLKSTELTADRLTYLYTEQMALPLE
uniref:N-acetyltransferase domain-containing protein n=1 Tax=Magnetococcus massalia (strain MO-1) TaxID=451514 RepID=A0A1S7LN29_MAGMO|nr:Conserved protein of unknown function [Candidatus Magnetococcus massalia]